MKHQRHRLSLSAPDVVEGLLALPEPQQCAITAWMVREALLAVPLESPLVSAAIERLHATEADRRLTRNAVSQLALRLDEEYFSFEEEGAWSPARHAFRRARAASALASALGGGEIDRLEAIYESLHAFVSAADALGRLRRRIAQETANGG